MKHQHLRGMSLFAFSLLALLQGNAARAAYVTESFSVTVPQSITDFNQSVTFQSFNNSQGTLVSVVVSYKDSAVMSGFVQNNSNSAQNFVVTENSQVGLSYESTKLLTNNLIATQSYSSIAAHQSVSFGTDTPSNSSTGSPITSGALFSAFQTPDSEVALTLGTLTSTGVVGGGGNVSTGIYTTVGATVTVTFTYVTIPEPSSVIMLACGGTILSVWQFRKNRTR